MSQGNWRDLNIGKLLVSFIKIICENPAAVPGNRGKSAPIKFYWRAKLNIKIFGAVSDSVVTSIILRGNFTGAMEDNRRPDHLRTFYKKEYESELLNTIY